MLIIAYFVVFFIGVVACFNEAKTDLVALKNNGLTVFEKRAYAAKAGVAIVLAVAGLGGLIQAAMKVI
ncbi:hypothetical protein F892_03092 [Acinetobacter vivianii]|uniref:Uncharacterized protein n=1 Tax=Acinetobacter vivianii TaxID=1776742 RepID=N9NGH1_9GAMM|nr:hypothetical protein [Acinetobacter vivianii]ENX20169.1 hypothetical protein F892_03092 [Acinetobacter vivianii]GGI59384.1 hypothetical protein GCM10011446_08790 [Acinetobacter vivianii]